MEEEKQKKSPWKRFLAGLKIAYAILTTLAVTASLITATYAWFSANSVVKTDRVSGRTGTDQIVLQVSQTGGADFKGEQETGIVQVNQYASSALLPVSTTDLQNFVYNPNTVQKEAIKFVKVEGEQYYYHGRIYLQVISVGHSENARVELYLDGEALGNGVAKNIQGYLANAARLGLVFDGGSRKILRVSESENPAEQRMLNTVIGGSTLTAGQVIDSSGAELRAANDPSEALSKYVIGGTHNGNVSPLLTMELNRIYTVDVFFYLEGCDPDCSSVTRMDALDLHLAFYGVLTEGEGE